MLSHVLGLSQAAGIILHENKVKFFFLGWGVKKKAMKRTVEFQQGEDNLFILFI